METEIDLTFPSGIRKTIRLSGDSKFIEGEIRWYRRNGIGVNITRETTTRKK